MPGLDRVDRPGSGPNGHAPSLFMVPSAARRPRGRRHRVDRYPCPCRNESSGEPRRAPCERAPGHCPSTPLPCEAGNGAIAGHRRTYGRPFHNVDRLGPGDIITLETPIGSCDYQLREDPFVVQPEDVWVVDPTPDPVVTLTTCEPKGSAGEASSCVPSWSTRPLRDLGHRPPHVAVDDPPRRLPPVSPAA